MTKLPQYSSRSLRDRTHLAVFVIVESEFPHHRSISAFYGVGGRIYKSIHFSVSPPQIIDVLRIFKSETLKK